VYYEEYADIHFVNAFCDGKAAAAVQEFETQFPIWPTPDL